MNSFICRQKGLKGVEPHNGWWKRPILRLLTTFNATRAHYYYFTFCLEVHTMQEMTARFCTVKHLSSLLYHSELHSWTVVTSVYNKDMFMKIHKHVASPLSQAAYTVTLVTDVDNPSLQRYIDCLQRGLDIQKQYKVIGPCVSSKRLLLNSKTHFCFQGAINVFLQSQFQLLLIGKCFLLFCCQISATVYVSINE